MTQNINLIEELEIQPTTVFNSKLVAQISVCWLLILILTYIWGLSVNSNRQKKLTGLEATQKSLTEKLTAYNQELIPLQQQDLKDQKDQKKILPLGSVNLQGFYLYLEDLAKYTPNGVWLKEINISEQDNIVTFKGSSVGAAGVSTFLNSLYKSIMLKNKKFNTLVMKTDPTTKNIGFIISSVAVNPSATPQTTEKEKPRTNEIIDSKILQDL